MKNGKVVIDTKAQLPRGYPIDFKVGNYEVLKCWEMAIT
jgi:hypothetical protein